jgi:hypothetical protein
MLALKLSYQNTCSMNLFELRESRLLHQLLAGMRQPGLALRARYSADRLDALSKCFLPGRDLES